MILCQCPKSGRDHFYGKEKTIPGKTGGVNALSRAGTISTGKTKEDEGRCSHVSMP